MQNLCTIYSDFRQTSGRFYAKHKQILCRQLKHILCKLVWNVSHWSRDKWGLKLCRIWSRSFVRKLLYWIVAPIFIPASKVKSCIQEPWNINRTQGTPTVVTQQWALYEPWRSRFRQESAIRLNLGRNLQFRTNSDVVQLSRQVWYYLVASKSKLNYEMPKFGL